MKAGTIVKEGVSMAKETSINNKLVTVTCSTLNSATKVHYACQWELDYSKVAMDKLLRLATRSIVIDLQREFRAAKAVDVKKLFTQKLDINVVLAERKRSKKTEAEKVADVFKGQTPEQVAALVQQAKVLLAATK